MLLQVQALVADGKAKVEDQIKKDEEFIAHRADSVYHVIKINQVTPVFDRVAAVLWLTLALCPCRSSAAGKLESSHFVRMSFRTSRKETRCCE